MSSRNYYATPERVAFALEGIEAHLEELVQIQAQQLQLSKESNKRVTEAMGSIPTLPSGLADKLNNIAKGNVGGRYDPEK